MAKYFLEKIFDGENLTRPEASEALESVINGEMSETQAGALLTALRMKGESVEEILGFLDTMQEHMVKVPVNDGNAIDMCGTGGDGSSSFNVSTTAALVVAAGGVTVAKHGNRSISSHCGSADLLAALGVKVDLPPEQVGACIDRIGIGFFFAPLYHPAMKTIAPVRRSLGIRTVFNMLGPLLNPASVRRQLIGVFNPDAAEKIANVLAARHYQKACTVHSADGFDEVSPFSETIVFESSANNGGVRSHHFSPPKILPSSQKKQIRGNSCQDNLRIVQRVLNGEAGAALEMTVLNAGFGFYVAGKVESVEEGIERSRELLHSGAARQKLDEFRTVSNELAG